MITAYFHGQLGNNLFQLATLLSYKENEKNIFLIDSVNRGTVEQINNFFIHPKKLEFRDMFDYEYNFLNDSVFNNFKNEFKIYNSPDLSLNKNSFFGYTKLPDEEFLILNGYFQSEKYFTNFKEKLRDVYFKPSSDVEKIFNNYDFNKSLSIHVRRAGDRHLGDMQDYFKDLEFDYYQESFKIINNKKQINKIYIFSDDIEWCEKNIKKIIDTNKEIIFVKNNKNYVDLFLMSMCENNIIGNSSFSWWAAWLNKNENKMVVAPKNKWFGPKLQHLFLDDLFPKEWTTL